MNEIHKRADLNLFRVLEAIERTGGISAAAESLHLTQSAVSHALSRLRALFNDELFVRHGRKMVPTTFARSILPSVRQHLHGLSNCIQASREFEPASLKCRFQLGFRDAAESLCFPLLLPELARAAPGVQIISRRIEPGFIERELTRGNIDLAADISIPTGTSIRSRPFTEEAPVVVYQRNHPLGIGRGRDWLDAETYAAGRHIVVSLAPDRPELLDHILQEQGIKRDIVLKCQHYFAACQVIARTDWFMLMPRSLAASLKQVLPVNYCPCPFPAEPLELRLYWHETMDKDPGNMWLREVATGFVRRHKLW